MPFCVNFCPNADGVWFKEFVLDRGTVATAGNAFRPWLAALARPCLFGGPLFVGCAMRLPFGSKGVCAQMCSYPTMGIRCRPARYSRSDRAVLPRGVARAVVNFLLELRCPLMRHIPPTSCSTRSTQHDHVRACSVLPWAGLRLLDGGA